MWRNLYWWCSFDCAVLSDAVFLKLFFRNLIIRTCQLSSNFYFIFWASTLKHEGNPTFYFISFAKSSHSVSVLSTAYYIYLMLKTVHYIVNTFLGLFWLRSAGKLFLVITVSIVVCKTSLCCVFCIFFFIWIRYLNSIVSIYSGLSYLYINYCTFRPLF